MSNCARVRAEQSSDAGAGNGPHIYVMTVAPATSPASSVTVTVSEGCVPEATYSVVRFMPSIGYGSIAVVEDTVDAPPAPEPWIISGMIIAIHAMASST